MKITMETGETYQGEVLAENERVVMLRLADGSRMQIRREEIAAMEPDAFTAIDRSDALPVVEASPGGQFGMMIEVGGGTSFSRNSYGWVPALQAAWVLGVRDVAWAGTFAGVGIGYNLCAANKSGEGAINLLPLFARLHSTIGRHVTAPLRGTGCRICLQLPPRHERGDAAAAVGGGGPPVFFPHGFLCGCLRRPARPVGRPARHRPLGRLLHLSRPHHHPAGRGEGGVEVLRKKRSG